MTRIIGLFNYDKKITNMRYVFTITRNTYTQHPLASLPCFYLLSGGVVLKIPFIELGTLTIQTTQSKAKLNHIVST